MGKLFWMLVGAGLALWGRHKIVGTYDKHVPPQVTAGAKKVGSSAKVFVVEVAKAQQQARQYLNDKRPSEVDVRDEGSATDRD